MEVTIKNYYTMKIKIINNAVFLIGKTGRRYSIETENMKPNETRILIDSEIRSYVLNCIIQIGRAHV